VTGPFHSALEDALLSRLEAELRSDRMSEIRVVVPTNLLGLRLSRMLAERVRGHAGIRFMTLVDLAKSLAGTPLVGGRVLLPSGADEVVLRKLLDRDLALGGYFERIADKPGLSGTLLAAIRDLKEACYTADSLAEAGMKAGLLRKGRDCKLTELLRIWRAYEAELAEGGWADTLDVMASAVDRAEAGGRTIAESPEGPDASSCPLIVYGFYDLNSLQRRLVAAHAATCGLVVYFPFVDNAAFDYARPTLSWFESLGLTRRDLPADAEGEIPLPPDVRIISAPGEAREAREDVRALAGMLDENDGALQDVAVLARTLDRYSEPFREELENLGAKAYLGSPPPLSRSRAGRSLIKLGEAVVAEFARTELMEFLSLADLDHGGGRPPVADWNKASVLAGITAGADSWADRLTALRERLDRADGSSRFAVAHGHLLDPIGQLLPVVENIVAPLSAAPARAGVGEYVDLLTRVFRNVTAHSRERELVLRAAGTTRALSEIAGDVTFAYFLELLRKALEEPGMRDERFGTGGPVVLNLMTARGLRFPTVVVPGLVEKEFPSTHRQDPVLLDAERERLNAARGADPVGSLPIRTASVDEERLLYHLALASAESTLLLSFPRLDPASARPRVPSPFILRTLDVMTGERHDYEKLESSELVTRIPLSRRFPEDRRSALTREEFDGCSVLRAVESGDAREVAYLVQGEGPLARGLEMETVRWGTPAFTKYDAVLTSPEAIAAIEELSGFGRVTDEGEILVAPTTLEDYARCPFGFFMSHVLDVEPLEEPEEALHLSPLEKGSLYHEVLEKFMRKAKAEGRLPLTTESRDELFRVAAGVAGSGKWSIAGLAGARELVLRSLLTTLSLWLAEETTEGTDYEPAYFEARFGGRLRPGDDEALSTENGVPYEAAGGVRVCFSGKIDRVDVSRDGATARVLDYKTGKPQKSGRKILDGGKRLQLPVYLLAASRMLERAHPGVTVDSAQYFYVGSDEGPSRMVLEREELEGAADDLAAIVAYVVRGVTSGMFFVPGQDRGCSFCDYADVCGSTAATLSGMKRGDPRVEFYTEQLSKIR
jgi:RecB family exonuclease